MEPATNLEQVTVIEHANFAVSDSRGDIVPGGYHGFYASDTRHLSRFALRLSGKRLEPLSASIGEHHRATFYLTNPRLGRLPQNSVAIFRDRRIGADLADRIRLISYVPQPLRLRLSLDLAADFADIFEVRGRKRLTRQVQLDRSDSTVRFDYEHLGYRRSTVVATDRTPTDDEDGRLAFDVELTRGVPWVLRVRVSSEISQSGRSRGQARRIDPPRVRRWAGRVPTLETDDPRLSAAWRQAIRDMSALLLAEPGGDFLPAAGVPWFMAVFGRDASITAMQSLVTGSDIAHGTLRALAGYQGQVVDPYREEDPGKIPHEVRTGELAALQHVPHQRYYGSVDATPLFVLLFVEACRWSGWLADAGDTTGSPATEMPPALRRLLPAVEGATSWIDQAGMGADGLVWYQRRHRRGTRNQAWKDSNDSYRFADGRVARTPIAAVEVQGYVVAAKRGLAAVMAALERPDEAARLRADADGLAGRIDDAFWMPAFGTYAMGLDRAGAQIDAVTSNPGHLLWCGVPSAARATAIADRLLAPDLFSGWGIRTMSSQMAAYNPISYHNGTVWPHDNSLIAAGLARYGYQAKAWRVIDALLDACASNPDDRLPELFAGFDRRMTRDLVAYPAACSPQAWATGAIFLAVQTILGIEPAADGPPHLRPIQQGPRTRLSGLRIGSWHGEVETGARS